MPVFTLLSRDPVSGAGPLPFWAGPGVVHACLKNFREQVHGMAVGPAPAPAARSRQRPRWFGSSGTGEPFPAGVGAFGSTCAAHAHKGPGSIPP